MLLDFCFFLQQSSCGFPVTELFKQPLTESMCIQAWGDCPCWECLGPPKRGILRLLSRVNVFQVSGTSHWFCLLLGRKYLFTKSSKGRRRAFWRSSAFTLVNLYVCVCCFPRRLLTGSMLFGQHVTIISKQLSQMSLSLRWELNRAWSSLAKHSMGKHFLTAADRFRCSKSSTWVPGMDRGGRRKGHTE